MSWHQFCEVYIRLPRFACISSSFSVRQWFVWKQSNWTFAHSRPATLHKAVANIVKRSPHLVSLTVGGTSAVKKWTTKLGDRIKHLSLDRNALPPISCKGLKCVALEGIRYQSRNLLSHSPYKSCVLYLTTTDAHESLQYWRELGLHAHGFKSWLRSTLKNS